MMIFEYLSPFGKHIVPYLTEISTALVACFLVMFGGEFNTVLRRVLRNYHIVIRTIIFILINAFGYGLIIVKATPYLARTLRNFDAGIMLAIVTVSFVVIGIWAQRNRQI